MLILYIYLRFRCILITLISLCLFYESLGVKSLFVNMTCENPISFYCEIKVIIIIIIYLQTIVLNWSNFFYASLSCYLFSQKCSLLYEIIWETGSPLTHLKYIFHYMTKNCTRSIKELKVNQKQHFSISLNSRG